jgi:hypothetical protein
MVGFLQSLLFPSSLKQGATKYNIHVTEIYVDSAVKCPCINETAI